MTYLTFDTDVQDDFSLHSTVSNTGRLLLDEVGWWLIGACVRFAADADGDRAVYVRINGTTAVEDFDIMAVTTATYPTIMTINTIWYASATTDYAEIGCWHEAGAAINAVAVGSTSPQAWAHLLGA